LLFLTEHGDIFNELKIVLLEHSEMEPDDRSDLRQFTKRLWVYIIMTIKGYTIKGYMSHNSTFHNYGLQAVYALEINFQYFIGRHFNISTDHISSETLIR